MRYRLACLDAGFTVLSPVRSLSEALRLVLAELPALALGRE